MKNDDSPIQKPPIFIEDGIIIIRASSSGKCLHQLCRNLLGYKAVPMPESFKKVCSMGNYLEGVIVDKLLSDGYHVRDQQRKVVLDLIPGIQIQGSIDGLIDIDGETCILEIKTRNKKRYDITMYEGVSGIPSMLIQGLVYASALDLKSIVFCTVHRSENTESVLRSLFMRKVTVPDFFKDWMSARLQRVVDFNNNRSIKEIDCEGSDLMCPITACPGGFGMSLNRDGDKRDRVSKRISNRRRRMQTSTTTKT